MAGRFPWWLVFFLLFFALQGSSALAAQQSAAPVRYRYLIDPSRSRVSFTFRGLAIPFDGHFGVVEGELFLDGGDIARGSSFWMKIPAASVRAGAKQQERMFLDIVLEADAHPFIEYKSTSLRLAAPVTKEGRENQYRLVVRGKLRLHGVEREIEVPVRLADTGTDLYIQGKVTIHLSDYDMARPRVLVLIPSADVIEVTVRLVLAPAPQKAQP
ncbi:MAG: YceI family protein [bacterium]|nr:YceI family protein [bacterium]